MALLAALAFSSSAAVLTADQLHKMFADSRPMAWTLNQGVNFGCYENQPERCEATVGKLTVAQPSGAITFRGKPVPMRLQSPLAALAGFPKPNYAQPLVYTAAQTAGVQAVCLTYTYDSFNGGAGPLDVLVMVLSDRRHAIAYRFDGIYSNCENWRSDGRGNFLYGGMEVLPDPQADKVDVDKNRKALFWTLCTLKGCARAEDRREVYWSDSWNTAPGEPAFRYDKAR